MTDDNTITLTPEIRSQAGSTALELMELARHANATGQVDSSIVTANEPMQVTLGMLFVFEAAFTALGVGDFDRGLAVTRELVKGVMAKQAEGGHGV